MASSSRDLESKILALPAEDRARIAARLLTSLEPGSDPDVEQAWLAEAERRLDELEAGRVQGVAANDVFDRAESTLK